jgi:hypothetical protein
MKNLQPMADFLTVYTNRIWQRTRDCAEDCGAFAPMLSFIDNHCEFSFPISYPAVVQVGRNMSNLELAAKEVALVGPHFGLFAMEIAQRSSVQRHRIEDRNHLFDSVSDILKMIHPQAFFLSLPVLIERNKNGDSIVRPARRSKKGQEAILVVGRNQVRSYSLITPYRQIKEVNGICYDRSMIFDSMTGEPHQAQGPFANIYEPCGN